MIIEKVEQITPSMIDDDCLALVVTVDITGMSADMARQYMKMASDQMNKAFEDEETLKILVVPHIIKIEVLRKTKDDDVKVINDELTGPEPSNDI
jgi:hypothetical protein